MLFSFENIHLNKERIEENQGNCIRLPLPLTIEISLCTIDSVVLHQTHFSHVVLFIEMVQTVFCVYHLEAHLILLS